MTDAFEVLESNALVTMLRAQIAEVTAERDAIDKDYGILLTQANDMEVRLAAAESALAKAREVKPLLQRSIIWLKRYQADEYLDDSACEELDALLNVASREMEKPDAT